MLELTSSMDEQHSNVRIEHRRENLGSGVSNTHVARAAVTGEGPWAGVAGGGWGRAVATSPLNATPFFVAPLFVFLGSFPIAPTAAPTPRCPPPCRGSSLLPSLEAAAQTSEQGGSSSAHAGDAPRLCPPRRVPPGPLLVRCCFFGFL